MKQRILFPLAIAVLVNFLCLAEVFALQNEKVSNTLSAREVSAKIVSTLKNNEQITGADLQHFQNHLRVFQSILEKKLGAADTQTRSRFTEISQLLNKIFETSSANIKPDSELYTVLKTIIAKTRNDLILAMANEEALRHADTVTLATIRPNRGHGGAYRANETVQLAVTALQDSFIQIFFLSFPRDKDSAPVLQPLVFSPAPGKKSVFLSGGDTLILGEDGSFVIEPPFGSDLIIVVATKEEIQPAVSKDSYTLAYPVDFEVLFKDIFGQKNVGKLSLHSCFIESRPADNIQATRS